MLPLPARFLARGTFFTKGPCDITHCDITDLHQADWPASLRPPARPLTRSPLAARPLLLPPTLTASLAVHHVERETLWDTGDHHDRQCLKQVITRVFGPLVALVSANPFESCASSHLCAQQGRWHVVPDPVLTSPSNKP